MEPIGLNVELHSASLIGVEPLAVELDPQRKAIQAQDALTMPCPWCLDASVLRATRWQKQVGRFSHSSKIERQEPE